LQQDHLQKEHTRWVLKKFCGIAEKEKMMMGGELKIKELLLLLLLLMLMLMIERIFFV
jgi:hypothetical protein